MFSNISTGAKNLYNSAKATMKKYTPKPFTAKEGTVEFFGAADPGVGTMTSSEAAAAIQKGTLSASELGTQTLTKPSGWFTKTNVVGVESDKIITDTINNAYQNRLKGFGKNATTMFNDIKTRAIELNTYVNDEQIGSFVENNIGTKQYSKEVLEYSGDMDYYGTGTGKYDIKTEIADLSKTGDYIDNGQGGYRFTGDKTFAKDPTVKKFDAKTAASKIAKGLLKKSDTPDVKPFYMASQDMTMQTEMSNYGETEIKGTAGGDFFTKVYGQEAGNRLKTYYKNMNLLHQNYAGIN